MFEQARRREPALDLFTDTVNRLRIKVLAMLEVGYGVASVAALISLVGMAYWCPRCGQWMGPGSEGTGPNVPNPEAPPIPDRLIKALSTPATKPTHTFDKPHPSEPNNKLRNDPEYRGQLHSLPPWKDHNGESAKEQYRPPSPAHGRRRDTYWGGDPEPDSGKHAHLTEFIRGDGQVIGAGGEGDTEKRLYERPREGPLVIDTGVYVERNPETGVYVWRPGRGNNNGG